MCGAHVCIPQKNAKCRHAYIVAVRHCDDCERYLLGCRSPQCGVSSVDFGFISCEQKKGPLYHVFFLFASFHFVAIKGAFCVLDDSCMKTWHGMVVLFDD